MAITKVTDSLTNFDTLTVSGTQAADTTYLKLENKPASAATNKVEMEFWGNEGTADASSFNMARIYGEFDGSSYATTRLTLGSASGGGTFNDELNIKNGNVSIGTTSADSIFHIESASTTAMTIQAGTNSSASLRLKNDAVDWDVNCQTNDNFAIFSQTASAERLVINGSGTVTFTGSSPVSSPYEGAVIEKLSNGARLNIGRSANAIVLGFYNTNGNVGSISTSGSSTAYNTSSDYRLKENIVTDWDATTRLKQLKPSRFNFIADADTTVDGFLAHEVSDIVPEAITGEKDATETLSNVVLNSDNEVIAQGITEDDWTAGKSDAVLWEEEDELPEGISVGDVKTKATYPSDSTWEASHTVPAYQGIDQSKLVPLLVKTIQELEARITTLENA